MRLTQFKIWTRLGRLVSIWAELARLLRLSVNRNAVMPGSFRSNWKSSILRVTSIRAKIFLGCICLTLVTVLLGLLAQRAQTSLGGTALGMYDDGFIPMNYVRSAQAIVLAVSRNVAVGDQNDAVFIDQLQSVLDALDVARERAMSSRGEQAAVHLSAAVSDLQGSFRRKTMPSRQQFIAVEQRFDEAVQIYTEDAFRLRQSVEAKVRSTHGLIFLAMAASVVAAFVITLLLSRAIVPSIRHAVGIATAIAAGRLDNLIETRQPSETGVLLDALSSMQISIAEKIRRIEELMAQQAMSFEAEIAAQHLRLEAALENMTLGLCMFDGANRLLVHNRSLVEMLGQEIESAEDIPIVLRRLGLDGASQRDQPIHSGSYNRILDDGRVICVSAEPMDKGGRVVTYEDITGRHHSEARLLHMARHDALTGLPNRVLFREYLEEGLRNALGGGVLTLLLLDLDRFKTVNDTLGHTAGDSLLREASSLFRQAAGNEDKVVRLGGDEFAVIQHSNDVDRAGHDARVLADRLIKALRAPVEIEGHHVTIGVSIGIAEGIKGVESADRLIKNADLALYMAKGHGRGTYRFFEPQMDAQIQARRQLEIDMLAALAEHQFELF